MRFIKVFAPAISALSTVLVGVASAVPHGGSFVPDAVLRVTEEERAQSCVPTKEILVVNGTSPGPALVFKEGETVWIRVYNDIPHQNLTMVCSKQSSCAPRWRPISYPKSDFCLLMLSCS
jgi:FtsP/CotA-like multicopper oxidase with cupredoxin domain